MENQKNDSDKATPSHTNSLSWPLADNLSLDQEKIKSILDKLSILWIKKILIVDDTPANISMAKRYLDNISLHIDYASNAAEAIEQIKNNYLEWKYDLILTDLDMETKKSGFDIVREWVAHQADTFVVTWMNYDKSHTEAHWPTTQVLWLNFSVKSKKDENWTRENVLIAVVDHIWSRGKHLHDALSRYNSHIWKPNYEVADTYISSVK